MINTNYNITDAELASIFEKASNDTKHKTGGFKLCCIDWYTRRDGSNVRVIRVSYEEPRSKPKKLVMLYDGRVIETGRDMVPKNELFPFTLNGLKDAVEFAKSRNLWQ